MCSSDLPPFFSFISEAISLSFSPSLLDLSPFPSIPFPSLWLLFSLSLPFSFLLSVLLYSFSLILYLPSSPLPLSLPCLSLQPPSLSLTPVAVSKVLIGCDLTLHSVIRCCGVSEFRLLISCGQLNAILRCICPRDPVRHPPNHPTPSPSAPDL